MANALARKYRVDVTADLTLASGWLQINGVNDFNDNITPNKEDSTAYDTNGWSSKEVTLQDAQLSIGFMRRLNAGIYDPGQELIRLTRGAFGDSARLGFRWYDRNNGPEAYSGIFLPEWERSNTSPTDLETISVTADLSDGQVNNIANPIAGTAVPTVTRATPAAQTAGNFITVTGGNFTGLTQVSIGGTAVTVASGKAQALSDSTLVFVVPAGSAGSAPIIVTNAAGASASFNYTRGS